MVAFSSIFVTFALCVSSALATIYITSPTADTTFDGGANATITYEDDGTVPTLSDWGFASVGIFVGSVTSQIQLQLIDGSLNVSDVSTLQFTVDPTIGPDSGDYFIRFQSLSYVNSTTGYPAEAFSAKFNLDQMTGTFNSSVSAVIGGTASSTGGAAPSASGPAPSSPARVTSAASAGASGSSTSHAASATVSSSGATSLAVSTGVALAGVAALFALVL